MSLSSKPVYLRLLIEEESGRKTLTHLLPTEPLDRVGLSSFTDEVHWSSFSVEIFESIFPSFTRIGINLPSVSLFSSCPLGNSESLEECSWLSVETNFSDSFSQCLRMEMLSINVMLVVWFFMELVDIEIFDTNT